MKMEKTEIKNLQHNNIFYYAGKIYVRGHTIYDRQNNLHLSAMECHETGKHRDFRSDTKVLFISPKFMKNIKKIVEEK